MAAPTPDEIKDRDSVEARFDTFVVDDEQKDAMSKIRAAALAFINVIFDNAPAGRERSSAFTAVEEAKYWANQQIAKNGVNSVDWEPPQPADDTEAPEEDQK